MEQDIDTKGVHNVHTRSFRTNTFSRVTLWINHALPPEKAKELEEFIEATAMAALKTWVES